jgi:hypothetical protein
MQKINMIRKLKYAAQRAAHGFTEKLIDPDVLGDLKTARQLMNMANTLEREIGYLVPVKQIQWALKAKKIRKRRCAYV